MYLEINRSFVIYYIYEPISLGEGNGMDIIGGDEQYVRIGKVHSNKDVIGDGCDQLIS